MTTQRLWRRTPAALRTSEGLQALRYNHDQPWSELNSDQDKIGKGGTIYGWGHGSVQRGSKGWARRWKMRNSFTLRNANSSTLITILHLSGRVTPRSPADHQLQTDCPPPQKGPGALRDGPPHPHTVRYTKGSEVWYHMLRYTKGSEVWYHTVRDTKGSKVWYHTVRDTMGSKVWSARTVPFGPIVRGSSSSCTLNLREGVHFKRAKSKHIWSYLSWVDMHTLIYCTKDTLTKDWWSLCVQYLIAIIDGWHPLYVKSIYFLSFIFYDVWWLSTTVCKPYCTSEPIKMI